MIKDGYGGVKMCRVQPGQTMSTAAPRRHGDMQLVRYCENLADHVRKNFRYLLNMTFEHIVGVGFKPSSLFEPRP